MNACFRTESDMTSLALTKSETLLEHLGYQSWMIEEVEELHGYFGIPDVVFGLGKKYTDGRKFVKVISFEFKRENWKRALKQAYRYKAFSDIAFVVIDACFADRVMNNLSDFVRTNIGLISFGTDGEFRVLHKPKHGKPFSESLTEKVRSRFKESLFEVAA